MYKTRPLFENLYISWHKSSHDAARIFKLRTCAVIHIQLITLLNDRDRTLARDALNGAVRNRDSLTRDQPNITNLLTSPGFEHGICAHEIRQKLQNFLHKHGPDKQLSGYALSLPRRELKILVNLLTDHITLNRHLTVMKIQADPLCSACGEQEETSLHFLGQCYANMQIDIAFLEHT